MEGTRGTLLRIFLGEDDEYDGRPSYEAIVELLRERGIAGVTVVRGIMGYGRSSVLHTSKVLRLSEDLPIVIECVDTAEAIEAVLPDLDRSIGDGLVTLETVEVLIHRGSRRP